MPLTLAPSKTYPVAVPAPTEAEARRKVAALEKLAANLSVDSLELIGKAAEQPGAELKLKTVSKFL